MRHRGREHVDLGQPEGQPQPVVEAEVLEVKTLATIMTTRTAITIATTHWPTDRVERSSDCATLSDCIC